MNYPDYVRALEEALENEGLDRGDLESSVWDCWRMGVPITALVSEAKWNKGWAHSPLNPETD